MGAVGKVRRFPYAGAGGGGGRGLLGNLFPEHRRTKKVLQEKTDSRPAIELPQRTEKRSGGGNNDCRGMDQKGRDEKRAKW